MKKEDLVVGRQYFYNGEWVTFLGKGSECDLIFTGKTKSYGFSLEMVEKLENCWRQLDLDRFKQGVINARASTIKSFSEQSFDEIVKQSVMQAWGDAKRPHSGIGQYDEKSKAQALVFLERALIDYFGASQKDESQFDEWHNKTCDELLTFYKDFVRSVSGVKNKKGIGFTYGSAQKLINMSFKYIYCFDIIQNNYSGYIGYFKNCHLAIDQYTADWLKSFSPRPVVADIGFSLITDYDAYFEAQKAARIRCKDIEWMDYGSYLIEKEFLIWEKYKRIADSKKNT